jgi:hypothetical protein
MHPRTLVKLRVQPGTDEVNFGGDRYAVNPYDQTVTVPYEAARPLLDRGGARLAEPDTPAVPDIEVRMRHPDAGASVSIGGRTYQAGEDGTVTVPFAMAAALTAHGFRRVA